ncbi:hypothetical protein CBR_g52202 [Chara braunii]|uniref:Uncharacterized protein n=1 Tax=Chara braunii TaxID=69332 RepID=A0A388M9T0_CHABU|nr:hypothetical protein CBR_g52202 [Chara braunii]|eukprot:GBG91316.1 hypothetical protein CBR_g52202 [Chara braunii]
MVICINWREVTLLSTVEAKWVIELSVSCGIVAGFTIGRMTGRGRGSKAGGRRGRWSNDDRYWMENTGSTSGGQTNPATYNVPGPVYPPGVNQHDYGAPYQQPIAAQAAAPVQPAMTATPVAPVEYPMVQHGPFPQPWGIQPWQMPGQWPINGQWVALPPVSMPPPANLPPVNQTASHQAVLSGPTNAQNAARNDPTANEFPGPGNRTYFTKEYMDILEGIKMNKAVEEAKKRLSGNRRTGIRIGEVDQKVKVTTDDKAELARLRVEKVALEKAAAEKDAAESEGHELSSSEKRKRMSERTPFGNSPRIDGVRSRGSKTKPRTKRIDISSEDEGDKAGSVKQNLQPKMETSSELGDIKSMLAALLQQLADAKGKAPISENIPASAPEDEVLEEEEDVDIVQNATLKDDEEESDEGRLAAYMKMRQEFYSSLHYMRVQELCKQKNIPYFKKDLGA